MNASELFESFIAEWIDWNCFPLSFMSKTELRLNKANSFSILSLKLFFTFVISVFKVGKEFFFASKLPVKLIVWKSFEIFKQSSSFTELRCNSMFSAIVCFLLFEKTDKSLKPKLFILSVFVKSGLFVLLLKMVSIRERIWDMLSSCWANSIFLKFRKSFFSQIFSWRI